MIVAHERNPRLPWLLAAMVLLGLIAVGAPGRLVSRLAYACERGRLQATSEGLAALSQDLARVEEVSHAFRLVAKVARPGVVHIRVRSDVAEESDDPMWHELRRQLEEQLGEQFDERRWQDFLRQHREAPASGSGIIFDEQGYILTNNHVVADRSEILVTLPDERAFPATLVGNDPMTDLAVIKVDASDLHALKFGDSDRVEVGDWVIAVGAPFGLSQSVTHGIISATGRDSVERLTEQGILYQNFLQTDAAINPGNSGGPLLNLRGEVIGVNTAIATNGDGYNAGIAFTIPSNMALKVASQLKESGEVARGWLGITMAELEATDRELLGIEGHRGVLVIGIIEGAPADDAGLQVEDVILEVGGKSVASMAQLRGAIADIFPGDNARLKLVRDGAPMEVRLILGRRPAPRELSTKGQRPRDTRELGELGLHVRTLLPGAAARLGYGEQDRGVLVWESLDQAADAPPVEPEGLIVACEGRTVTTVADLKLSLKELKRGAPVQLEVVNPAGERRTLKYKRR